MAWETITYETLNRAYYKTGINRISYVDELSLHTFE